MDVPTFEDAQALQAKAQELYPDQDKIQAVRLGPGPILKATIPWRSFFTPMIAPMLHWGRGMEDAKQYPTNNGRDGEPQVALEV